MRIGPSKLVQLNELSSPPQLILIDESQPDLNHPMEVFETTINRREVELFTSRVDWNQPAEWKGVFFNRQEMHYLRRALDYFMPHL